MATPSTTPSVTDADGETPRTTVEISSVSTGGSGSTDELVATIVDTQPSLYDEMRDTQTLSFTLPFGTLLRRPVPLGSCTVEDEIGTRSFGTSVDDFKRLCLNVAWDYPAGILGGTVMRNSELLVPG